MEKFDCKEKFDYKEQAIRQIQGQIDLLGIALEDQGRLVNLIETQLQPALRKDPPEGVTITGEPDQVIVPMAENIRFLYYLVMNYNGHIRRILDRLEI